MELSFSGEELTFLAQAQKFDGWPTTSVRELDAAGWDAVARGLIARGVLGEDHEPIDPAVAELIDVILEADESLNLMVLRDEGVAAYETMFRRGAALVSELPGEGESRRLVSRGVGAVDVLQAEALAPLADGCEPEAGAVTVVVAYPEHEAAVQLAVDAGAAVAAGRHPVLSGYLHTIAGGSWVMHLERRRSRELGWGIDSLTLWGAPGHPLWQRTDEDDEDDDDTLRCRIEPLGPEQARQRILAFFAGFVG